MSTNPLASAAGEPTVLSAAIGRYPHTAALHDGRIMSDRVRLDFADIAPINRAFAPMVREQRFAVGELAIATFLQAKAHSKPLVLLPVVLAARFQQSALLCRSEGDISSPGDLRGRRVGVRAYSQTTGVWLRGILADAFNVQPDEVRWTTFEDAHVAEVRDPPWAERAPPGGDMLAMLREGELDAVIVGNELPNDPGLRTVFPDPDAAAATFWQQHGFVPANHLLTIRSDLARRDPGLVREVVRLFTAAKAAMPAQADSPDPYPLGRAALEPAIALVLRYAAEQGLLPRPLDLAEVWEGLPDDIAEIADSQVSEPAGGSR